jgi:hypothetical protein
LHNEGRIEEEITGMTTHVVDWHITENESISAEGIICLVSASRTTG